MWFEDCYVQAGKSDHLLLPQAEAMPMRSEGEEQAKKSIGDVIMMLSGFAERDNLLPDPGWGPNLQEEETDVHSLEKRQNRRRNRRIKPKESGSKFLIF